jgi:hypothetical protein
VFSEKAPTLSEVIYVVDMILDFQRVLIYFNDLYEALMYISRLL